MDLVLTVLRCSRVPPPPSPSGDRVSEPRPGSLRPAAWVPKQKLCLCLLYPLPPKSVDLAQ
eukprot:1027753-Rhodomonas_salina.1